MSYADHCSSDHISGGLTVAAGVTSKTETDEDSLRVDFDGGFANSGDRNKVYRPSRIIVEHVMGPKKRGHFSFKK